MAMNELWYKAHLEREYSHHVYNVTNVSTLLTTAETICSRYIVQ